MNKDLYGHTIKIPQDVLNYLKQCFESAKGSDDSTEGYRRNMELRKSGEVTYQQLKRIKNFFDNFQGHQDELPYILNGGHYVKNWVNQNLKSMRDDVKLGKKVKSEVLPNQFIQNHEKNSLNTMNRPSKSHSKATDQYNLQVTESLKRINELIQKII